MQYSTKAIPNNREFWNPATLGYRFFAEAKRLWEVEICHKPSLLTVQAAAILHMLYSQFGMDKINHTFCTHSLRILFDHGYLEPIIIGETYRSRRSRGLVSWQWFWMQA